MSKIDIKNTAIIGNLGLGRSVICDVVKEKHLDMKIITEAQDMLEATSFKQTNEPYILHQLPQISPYPEQKKFICKGKHQYRKVLEESEGYTISTWICQCGKKL